MSQSFFPLLVRGREATAVREFVLHLTLLGKLIRCWITSLALFKPYRRDCLAPTHATEIQQCCHCSLPKQPFPAVSHTTQVLQFNCQPHRDYPAIVFQHEIDHLHGHLYYDHIDLKAPWQVDNETKYID